MRQCDLADDNREAGVSADEENLSEVRPTFTTGVKENGRRGRLSPKLAPYLTSPGGWE